MKPSSTPSAPSWVIRAWMSAPSARPWKSSTSGSGSAPAPVAGADRRYRRAAPRTSSEASTRLASGSAASASHPADGTAVGVEVVGATGAASPSADRVSSSPEHAPTSMAMVSTAAPNDRPI
jgi:hypothetical protein